MNQQTQEKPEGDVNDLIERAKAGDKEAFVALMQIHDSIIRAIAQSFSRHHKLDVDDLVNEVMLRAYIILPQFRGKGAEFKSWLRKTSWGICNNLQKKQTQLQLQLYERRDELHSVSQSAILQPDKEYAQKTLQECVREAIGKLPEKERKLVYLKDIIGLRYEEISSIFKKPLGTIQAQLFRGRKKLERLLKKLHCHEMLD